MKTKIMWWLSLLAVCVLFFAGCGDNDNDGDGDGKDVVQKNAALRAEPVAAALSIDEPKLLDYWTDGEKNWYVIDVGYIRNSLVMKMGPTEYSGYGTITLSMTESIETSMTKSRTETVSNSVVVSDASRTTASLDATVKAKIPFVDFSVKGNLETERKIDVVDTKSTQTSQTFITSLTESSQNSTQFTINRDDPIGHYRYAWYDISDVYFIVSTSSDNQNLLSWDVVSCPRGSISGRLEYSTDGKFDNSPKTGKEIVFADDFYKNLPKPSTILIPQRTLTINTNPLDGGSVSRNPNLTSYDAGTQVTLTAAPYAGYTFTGWTGAPSGVNTSNASITFAINSNLTLTANFRNSTEKKDTISFSTDGRYTFNKTFPATIEVYALGAGGGGQGGYTRTGKIDGDNHDGTGGGGGGGAAAYMKLTVDKSVEFQVNIGVGGQGGNSYSLDGWVGIWQSGYSGSNGGNTKVTWNSNTLTVAGGSGGGGTGEQTFTGGDGGKSSAKPAIIEQNNFVSESGKSGSGGVSRSSVIGKGGNAGTIMKGSLASFGGGEAGVGGDGNYKYDKGKTGGNGKVVIVVTYEL